MIESSVPSAENRRQARYSIPLRGSTAIVVPWLMGSAEELICCGALHVAPQFRDRDR